MNQQHFMIIDNLRVFARAKELARVVYANLPESAELRDQVKRSSLSVGANIAEGCTMSGAMRSKHYRIARGSAVETVAHYELAVAIGEAVPAAEVRAHGAAIAAMLTKMLGR